MDERRDGGRREIGGRKERKGGERKRE